MDKPSMTVELTWRKYRRQQRTGWPIFKKGGKNDTGSIKQPVQRGEQAGIRPQKIGRGN